MRQLVTIWTENKTRSTGVFLTHPELANNVSSCTLSKHERTEHEYQHQCSRFHQPYPYSYRSLTPEFGRHDYGCAWRRRFVDALLGFQPDVDTRILELW